MPQGFPLGVSADDMLSSPVSLSTAPAMPRPSSSTLFNDDESLSDIATRLAPLRKHNKNTEITTHAGDGYTPHYIIVWWTYLEVLCTGWTSGLDIGDEGELFLLLFDNDLPNCTRQMEHGKNTRNTRFVNITYDGNNNIMRAKIVTGVWIDSRSVWTRRPNSC